MPYYQGRNITTYYETHGEGKPIVFIHGAWVSHKMWLSQRDYFVELGYKVVLYDVRGHGLTGATEKKKYSMELFADDLDQLLDGLGIDMPIVCGLSMGGMIAQCYGSRYPHKISALILCDTAVSTALTLSDKITKYLLAPKWLFIALVKLMGIKRYTEFAFWFAKVSRSKEWVGDNPEIEAYEKGEMLLFSPSEFNKIFSGLYDFKLQPIERIKVPVLIINGEFESSSVHKHGSYMKKLMPHSRLEIIKNAGHTCNMEQPEEFNSLLHGFLQKI